MEFTQKTGCSKSVADWTLWGQIYLSELRREHPGWNTAWFQEWGLFLLEHLLHIAAAMRWKEHEILSQRCSQAKWPEMAEVTAPEHPSIRTLLGFEDATIMKVTKQVYLGEYVLAPSMLPCQWQEECIIELCIELAWCMARAGLWSEPGPARPTLWSRRCSHNWAWSPSAEPQWAEVAKHPREDSLTGQSGSRMQHSCSKDELQWCQSPSPQHPGVETFPHRPGRHSSPDE